MEIYKKKIKKNAIFRLNVNNFIGLGHLLRCLKIINKIKNNYKIFLILDSQIKNTKILNLIRKFNVIYLYNKKKYKNQNSDASLFIEKTNHIKKHVIFVDDYRFNSIWHKKIYNIANKLVVIDDFFNKKIYCDFYINYKHKTDSKILKFQNNYNKRCKLLIGRKYIPLDDKLHKSQKNLKKRKINVMINFGNSFDFNKIKLFLKNFLKTKSKIDYNLFICIGVLAKNYKYLYNISKFNKNIILILHKLSLANYLNKTDLFIGSSGNSVYDNSYLNIPSIFIELNNNQKNQINDLMDLGHFFSFKIKDVSNPNFILFVKVFLNKFQRLTKLNLYKSVFIKKNNINNIVKEIKL